MRPSWKIQVFSVLTLCGTSLFWLVDPLVIKWLIDSVFVCVGFVFRRQLQDAAIRSREAAGRRNSLLMESLVGAIQIQLLDALIPIKGRYVRGVVDAVRVNLAERRKQLAYSAAS